VSTTRYIIEGNLVTAETVSLGRAVPLESLLEGLTAYQPLELGHLPKNLMAIKVAPQGDRELTANVLITQNPTRRHISYKNVPASHNMVSTPYNIQLPYNSFWIQLQASRTFGTNTESLIWVANAWGNLWSITPYDGWQTKMWRPRFPNIFGDSRICFGSVRQDSAQSLGHFVDSSINGFFTSEFNNDVGWGGPNNFTMEEWAASDTPWEQWDMWNDAPFKTVEEWFSPHTSDFNWSEPVPQNSGAPIPALQTYPTFNNLNTWIDGLSTEQHERLIFAISERETNDNA